MEGQRSRRLLGVVLPAVGVQGRHESVSSSAGKSACLAPSGLSSQAMAPRTRYAKCGDLKIAYQVTGDAPSRAREWPVCARICKARPRAPGLSELGNGRAPCFTEDPTASEDQHVRGVEWRPYARLDGRNQLSGSRSSVPMPADARSAAAAPFDMRGGFWRSTGSGLVSAASGFASPGRPVVLGMTSRVLRSRPRCRRGRAAQRASTSSAARSPAWIAPSM